MRSVMGLKNNQFLLSASRTTLMAVLDYGILLCIMAGFVGYFKGQSLEYHLNAFSN